MQIALCNVKIMLCILKLFWIDFLYERSHAPRFSKAVTSFLALAKFRRKRLHDIGWKKFFSIAELELAAALAGLNYPSNERGITIPWLIPVYFLDSNVTDLPAHPLIEADFLRDIQNRTTQPDTNAVASLLALLKGGSFGDRWAGINTFNVTRQEKSVKCRIAVCLHLFYPDLWPKIFESLNNIAEPWDLFITIPQYACVSSLKKIVEDHPNVTFFPYINRGRDVLPFVNLLNLGVFDNYDAVLKIHSKRSLHMSHGDKWLNQLLEALLPNKTSTAEIIRCFDLNQQMGMIGPSSSLIGLDNKLHKSRNHHRLQWIAARAHLSESELERPFFAGTMFWFRPAALSRLKLLNLNDDNFEIEMAQTDGTLAHAIERCLWPLAEQAGYQVVGR